MQQDKISIDLKPPTKWEDLSDKQLRYVFALLAQGFTATEVKAYCLHRWAGLKVLHRYGNLWAYKHDGLNFVLAAEQVERATHALDWLAMRADGRFFEVSLSQAFLEICD